MKNIKYMIMLLFVGFLFSCTAEDSIEEDTTNTIQNQEIYGTGEDGESDTDNDRDGG